MTEIPTPDYTEDGLVETPSIELFEGLGWRHVNAYHERTGPGGDLGREHRGEVLLTARLIKALRSLNPELDDQAIREAVSVLARDRSTMTPVAANQEIYDLLKDGIPVGFRNADGEQQFERLRVIDWQEPANNDFLLASQFWVTGELSPKRPDLVGFVNGIPLLLVEFKAPQKPVKDAYKDNLRDYKNTIPQLFWYNAFIILSNGSDARIGTLTSPWEHFAQWKKISDEDEPGIISLETMLHGTCEPGRFLDLIENFTLFFEAQGGTRKILAKNHQYLGVNNAIEAVQSIEENRGRLGVFWHTQGSGKSFSMIFFSQKVLRKLPGSWTFLIVTDRLELDDQIYKNFANAGAINEPQSSVRAQDGEHLKQMLSQEDHRHLFTLIQKFRTEPGQTYPTLSERDDIIVMTDEAHRTQYDVLALNMRNALPNAAYLAYTGTPLIAEEERTREVFGEYVSVYDFQDSIQDGATVPLYYENRVPELQIVNEDFNEDMERLLEDIDLDEAQEEKLERAFRREYHLITREDRLDRIGEDIVDHFLGRGHLGKAMVVSIDKATAVRTYDKFKKHWDRKLAELRSELSQVWDRREKERLEARIEFMEETDVAVVVSSAQNEVEDLAERGADIRPHRQRMNNEDLATKFKVPDNPLRIVFVCAMWMTGFDAPACSTIYLDKPMRNHTLMQTIARANRVWGEKNNGLIVDYIGIFRNLQKALAIYATGPDATGEVPVKEKDDLVAQLRQAIQEAEKFCQAQGVDLGEFMEKDGFHRIKLIDEAADAMLADDETHEEFTSHVSYVDRLFRAILPDKRANEFGPTRKALVVIRDKIRSLDPEVDISHVMDRVEKLLDDSVAAEPYVIKESPDAETGGYLNLSEIDFEALRERFEQGRKHIEIERLRRRLEAKLEEMIRKNRTRMDYLEEFQRLIDEYNRGASEVDVIFEQLVQFTKKIKGEDRRAIEEQLSEEELAIFDLLMKPRVELSDEEIEQVKEVARDLLDTLRAEYLVLDWRKRQRSRAGVQVAIRDALAKLPPDYPNDVRQEKPELIYQHVFDAYWGAGENVYSAPDGGE